MVRGLARLSKNTLIPTWKEEVDSAFGVVDTNGDGEASPKELMAALEEHGFPDINGLFE